MICSTCHGGCCRRYYIDLTGYDLINIQKALMMDFPVFTQIMRIDENEIDFYMKESVIFKFTDDGCKDYYRLCLKRVPSRYMQDSTQCMFLQEWNSEVLNNSEINGVMGRCGIYGCRPLICAIFPTKFDLSGHFGYSPDPTTSFEKKKNPAYNLCPRILQKDDFSDNSDITLKNLILQKFESDFFRAMSVHWNEEPKSINDLFAFIKKVYANRVFTDYDQ